MSDDNDLDRRTVLKRAGVGAGVGLASLSGGAAAEETTADPDLVERMERSPEVRSLLADVGGSLSGEAVRKHAVGDRVTVAAADLSAGTLLYAEDADGNADALLTLDGRGLGTYEAVPEGTSPVLFGTSEGTLLRRMATERERRAVEDVVGVSGEETIVYTGTEYDGFRLDVQPEDPRAEEARRYEVTPADGRSLDTTTETLEPFDDDLMTHSIIDDPEEACDDCCPPCVSCVASLGTCGRCYFVCAGSPTGVGAILCVACLKVFCEISGVYSCGFCIDCLQDNGHL